LFELDTILNGLFNAVLTGSGVAVGTWFSNKIFLAKMEKIIKQIKKVKK